MENKVAKRGRPKGSFKTLKSNPFLYKENYLEEDKTPVIKFNIFSEGLKNEKTGAIYIANKNSYINYNVDLIINLMNPENFLNRNHQNNCFHLFFHIIKNSYSKDSFTLNRKDITLNNKPLMNEKTFREAINWFKDNDVIAQKSTTNQNVSYFLNIKNLSSHINPPKYIKKNYPNLFPLHYTTTGTKSNKDESPTSDAFDIPNDTENT